MPSAKSEVTQIEKNSYFCSHLIKNNDFHMRYTHDSIQLNSISKRLHFFKQIIDRLNDQPTDRQIASLHAFRMMYVCWSISILVIIIGCGI